MALGHGPTIATDGLVLALDVADANSYDPAVFGQQTYTSSGTYSWTCPSGVTSVSVVCIGGGGGGNGGGYGVGGAGGGGGGGLGYKNNIPVTPGQSYTVVVGGGGAGDAWDGPPYSTNPADSGGDSYFIDATTVKGGGGGGGNGNSGAAGGSGGTYVGDGGGNGYSGGTGSSGGGTGYMPATGGGGGSTGTYTGNATTRGTSKTIISNCTSGCLAGSGTGQGLLGTGSSGSYGRGGGSNMNTFSNGTSGYTGAVRIMWGNNRSYPSTNVADQSASTIFTDLSGRGNNGTITNEPIYSSADGGFFTFDGTDEYVTVDDAIRTDVGEFVATSSNPFSISAWFKPDITDTTRNAIFAKAGGYGSSGNIFLQYNGTNLSSVIRGSSTSNFYSTLTSTWHEIAICWDGTTFKSYINGSFVSNLNVGTANSQDKMFSIGNSNSGTGSEPFKGDISIVKVYNKSLTASEIQQNFNALRGRFGI